MSKKAVVLINVGTPDNPDRKSVKKYLKQFLNDPDVIDIPAFFRYILVNFIIIPFRTRKSAKLYKKLWSGEGSPLLVYTKKLVEKLNQQTDGNTSFYYAMRYGNPAIRDVFAEIEKENYDEIVVFPMFPQYASSTTGTVIKYCKKLAEKLNLVDKIRYIEQFNSHPLFVKAFTTRVNDYKPDKYDHVVFSFHGLPLRQIRKIHPEIHPENCNCVSELPEYGHYCYKATCYETTRLMAKKVGVKKENYSVAFQSRLSRNWLQPFTDEFIAQLAYEGKKSILVVAPSFVTDCLETIVEIGDEYNKLFKANGGERLTLVDSLNTTDLWVSAIKHIANNR
ncbi:MAG: ferrochelatase [Bacteroidales bacterium]